MRNGSFTDRIQAGHELARALAGFHGSDAVLLGMARGGVAVGFAVAQDLSLPLHALVVRKLGAPGNPELAIGAVSETGVRWIDHDLARLTGATPEYLDQEIEAQVAEAKRRQQEYAVRGSIESIKGRRAIVVDDGIATGASALVAAQSARGLEASEVILAAPAASRQALRLLQPYVDRIVALITPDPFLAVGMYYQQFGQVSDAEVVGYLDQSLRADR